MSRELEMTSVAAALGVIAGVLLCMVFVHVTGLRYEARDLRSEIVDRGCAEYIVTDNKGSTEFKWKEAAK